MCEYLKSPFNWNNDKHKHIEVVNELVENNKYLFAVEVFMGSGNLILNLPHVARFYIGNDKRNLIPHIYTMIGGYQSYFRYNEVESIIINNNRFSSEEDYYNFRAYWNNKYLNQEFDRKFCIETVLLLKMCANSMIEFDDREKFDQGFCGMGNRKEFFVEDSRNSIVEELNKLYNLFKIKQISFFNSNYRVLLAPFIGARKSLFILDPPYVFDDRISNLHNENYMENDSSWLFQFLSKTHHDFIYFDYLICGKKVNQKLLTFTQKNQLRVVGINDFTIDGKNKRRLNNYAQEVIVTNIR